MKIDNVMPIIVFNVRILFLLRPIICFRKSIIVYENSIEIVNGKLHLNFDCKWKLKETSIYNRENEY